MSAAEDTLTLPVPALLPVPTLDEQIRKLERSEKYWKHVKADGERIVTGADVRLHDVVEKLKQLRARKRRERTALEPAATPEEPSPVAEGDMPGTDT
jgi:hypothetical protein